jgi:hypothetical protein
LEDYDETELNPNPEGGRCSYFYKIIVQRRKRMKRMMIITEVEVVREFNVLSSEIKKKNDILLKHLKQ